MANDRLVLPALRGSFGRWIFYSCLVPITEVGKRVKFAEDIHTDKALSRLIQRSLEGPPARQIAQYLSSNEERFFNSLVLATYGRTPQWLEVSNFPLSDKLGLGPVYLGTSLEHVGLPELEWERKALYDRRPTPACGN
ncbi:hypothetical protein IAE29_23690 [Ochrobactrum sp. S46]|nr:hypothetical protein [Ochrobactrum sp. S45]MBK0046320.1 hypothetical protein [Ochrobactrum sp. S46]